MEMEPAESRVSAAPETRTTGPSAVRTISTSTRPSGENTLRFSGCQPSPWVTTTRRPEASGCCTGSSERSPPDSAMKGPPGQDIDLGATTNRVNWMRQFLPASDNDSTCWSWMLPCTRFSLKRTARLRVRFTSAHSGPAASRERRK